MKITVNIRTRGRDLAGLSNAFERHTSFLVNHTQESFGTYRSAGVLCTAHASRYVGALHSEAGDGVVVEKLKPGPFCFTIPVMTVPVAPTMSREDKIMLSLHYRWALQVLSAFRFMHSRSVYAGFFSSELAWIRTDFSLAVTGFISASATEIEDEFWDDVHEDSRTRLPDSYLPQEGGRQEDRSSHSVSCSWDEGEGVEAEMIAYDGSFAGLHVQGSVQKDL